MLITLAVLLAIAWIFGFAVFHVANFGIHLLLALAVIAIIAHFVGGPNLFSRRRDIV